MKSLPPQDPGVYPGNGLASLLRANEQQYLFQQQRILTGQASIAVQLERIKSPHFYPTGCSLQIWFTDANGVAADPGTFDIELQASDVDIDGLYANMTGLTALNATFAGRIESPWSYAKYVRALAKTVTNAVYSNVLITR